MLDEVEEHLEGMLHERQARRGPEVGLGFLLPRVWGVVGRDDVDDAGRHGRAHGGPVGGGLDRRVAFDLVAEAGVIFFGEPEMVHAGFGGQSFPFQGRGVEEAEFLRGGDM